MFNNFVHNTDYVSYALALEEIAAGDGATSTIMSVNNAPVCAALLKEGSEEQKQELLIPLAKGALIGAFCLTESQAVNSPIQATSF